MMVLTTAGLAGALVLVLSLWPGGPDSVGHAYVLAPENALPEYFRKAPPNGPVQALLFRRGAVRCEHAVGKALGGRSEPGVMR